MGRIFVPAFLLVLLSFTVENAFGQRKDAKKAEKELVKGEKYLFGEGVRKSVSRAVTCFKKARKLLPDGPATEGLAARIAMGLGTAYADRKKYKDAASELRPLAEGFANRTVRWKGKVYGSGPTVEWTRSLKEAREAILAGKDLGEAVKKLKEVARSAGSSKMGARYAQVADVLLGMVSEKSKKFKEASDYYISAARAQVDTIALQAKQRAEREAKRPRTPKKIPAAEAPPGELKGKYLEAVNKGLDWLKKFQKDSGEWSEGALEEMSKDDPLPAGRAKLVVSRYSHALTCMAYLRAGVQLDDPNHGDALKKGLAWLKDRQEAGGRLFAGDKAWQFVNHHQATWVLAESVLRLKDPEPYREPLEKAVEYSLNARNPGAGWRFGVRPGDNDTANTAPALIALSRAKRAGVEVPPEAIEEALGWLSRVTDEVTGKVGYCSKGDPGVRRADAIKFKPVDTATATALASRILLGEDPKTGLLGRGYDTLWSCPPQWIPDRDIHLKYARYYTLAYGLRPGADANYNLKRMADLLVKNQEKEKSAEGSWPPIGSLASDGRIAGTARAILSILNARGVNLPEPLEPAKEK